MKYKLLTAVFICIATISKGQQLPTSSMYDLQGVTVNPSVAGTQTNNIAGISYRNQWSGISGSPATINAFGSFNLPKYAMGIGGTIYNDKTGPTSRSGVTLSLAKHIVGNNGTFSIGIENRFQQYSIDKQKLQAALGNDPVLGTAENKFNYDAGFGVSYTTKTFQLGASVSQLIQSKLNYYTGDLTRDEEARNYRHYFFHGLYNWDVDGTTVITPTALFVYLPNAPLSYQVGARVEFNKSFWFGGGYRSRQSYTLTAGLHINKVLTLGYSYDEYVTPISLFDNGSGAHEVLLRYNFIKK